MTTENNSPTRKVDPLMVRSVAKAFRVLEAFDSQTPQMTLSQIAERTDLDLSGAPEFNVCNPMGTVHGGWYGTLLDSAMACAVMTKVPRGSVYTTLEYKVNILRAIPLGMQIDCIGTIDHVGRSTGVAHGEIRGVEDGKLYATGSTTCIVMKIA